MEEIISIVIPVYNEERTIEKDIQTIRTAMEKTGYNYEIIVVDDASTDSSGEIARRQGVKVIRHPINRGVGAARKTGILEAQGNVVVTTDGDGTYPNQDIPKLLEFIGDFDMVVGARTGKNVAFSPLRALPKYFIRQLGSYLSGRKIPDLNSGFRAFKKDIALKYFHLIPNSHSFVGTITLAFLCSDHLVKFIPIDYYKRKGKSSFRPLSDTVNYISLVIRTIMYFRPLRIFLPISFFAFIIGAVKVVYDFFVFHNIGGFDVVLMLFSFLIATLGLLADLILTLHKK